MKSRPVSTRDSASRPVADPPFRDASLPPGPACASHVPSAAIAPRSSASAAGAAQRSASGSCVWLLGAAPNSMRPNPLWDRTEAAARGRDAMILKLTGPGGMPVDLKRTRRKRSVGIAVEDRRVQVFAPKWVPLREIQEIITKRSSWIGRQIQLQASRPAAVPKQFSDGEEFLYLGRAYVLRLVGGQTPGVALRAGQMMVTVPTTGKSPDADAVRTTVLDWYQSRAEDILAQSSARMSDQLGVTPIDISVREYRSQWGSCSSSGHIRYNRRIVLAPWEVVEYVTAHELSHLRHADHSLRFWRCVESLDPGYRQHRDWLRLHGGTLQI